MIWSCKNKQFYEDRMIKTNFIIKLSIQINRNDQEQSNEPKYKNYKAMKLAEQQFNHPQQDQTCSSQKQSNESESFLNPLKILEKSVSLSIIIHFVRSIFVSVIYYESDLFLHNPKNSSQPWNSLLYFLAMMIEVIKFIGDCSLRNVLRSQQKKLRQIQSVKQKMKQSTNMPQNITLKGGKYEDYLFVFSLVKIFKYQHKNYSSAFSISKYMHIACTFLLFGWMSLRQQYNQETNWIQLVVLEVFLYSIYFTSFQMDLYLIQTSNGKFITQQNYSVTGLSPTEVNIVKTKFHDWRRQYLLYEHLGLIAIVVGVLIQCSLSLYAITAFIVLVINLYGDKLEKSINSNIQDAINSMKREQINTYSLLKKSTTSFEKIFKLFIIFQRASLIFLCFSFARDQSLNSLSFYVIGTLFPILEGSGIILLIMSQTKKFNQGNKLKLMAIIQNPYSHDLICSNQPIKDIQCAICLNVLQIGQKVKFLPCSKEHIYHSNCFDDWKKIKKQCPLCRYPLSEYI